MESEEDDESYPDFTKDEDFHKEKDPMEGIQKEREDGVFRFYPQKKTANTDDSHDAKAAAYNRLPTSAPRSQISASSSKPLSATSSQTSAEQQSQTHQSSETQARDSPASSTKTPSTAEGDTKAPQLNPVSEKK